MKLITLALLISILFESVFTTIPLTLLVILFITIVLRESDVFIFAFLSGLLLDIFSYRVLGISSAIFVTLITLVFLYQRKFEIESFNFLVLISFSGTLVYLFITGASNLIFQTLFSTLLISFSYLVFKKTNKKKLKYA